MPTYTVTKIVYKANGDKEFYNVDTLETTCQAITAESVSGTTHTLTTNTGEIIYDALDLECVYVEPSGSNPGGLQCFIDGNPVSSDYWLSQQPGGGAAVWGGITGTLSAQTDLQAALDAKEPDITPGTSSQYWRGDKSWQTLDKAAVGLGNVDNTSDLNKPVSTATQTALDGKENTIVAGTTAQYWRGDKSWQTLDKSAVGLGNVDNTSDLNKPISTATQTALNAKQDTLVSGTNIKTINGSSVLGSGDLTVTGSNIANADLTSTGDRTHNFATNFLKFINATEYRWDSVTTDWAGSQHFLRMYQQGSPGTKTFHFNARVGDGTNRAAFQLNAHENGGATEAEISTSGNVSIHLDSDQYVKVGTTNGVGTAGKLRVYGNSNAQYVELTVADTINASVSYTLPHVIVNNGVFSTNGSGVTSWLNATQLTALLNVFTDALKGAVPASGGGTANFLRADGTWAPPSGGSGLSANQTRRLAAYIG